MRVGSLLKIHPVRKSSVQKSGCESKWSKGRFELFNVADVAATKPTVYSTDSMMAGK